MIEAGSTNGADQQPIGTDGPENRDIEAGSLPKENVVSFSIPSNSDPSAAVKSEVNPNTTASSEIGTSTPAEASVAPGAGSPNVVPEEEQSYKLNDNEPYLVRLWDVVRNFPYMGCTAFGGPAMAITLLQDRFVKQKKWLDEPMFKELFALIQGIPGPSQGLMSVALGTVRAGILGGVVALILYSLPGFAIMTLFGILSFVFFDPNATSAPDWMAGLGPAAISLLFLAAVKLAKQHCSNSKLKMLLGLLSACGTLLVTGDARVNRKWAALMFPAFLIGGGLTTYVDSKRKDRQAKYFTKKQTSEKTDRDLIRKINISKGCGVFIIVIWLTTLVTFIVLRGEGMLNQLGQLFESLFRVGSMIFGGGYVVLPMLLQEQIVSSNQFFQGFALVQALPGPLFNFSAFLGAASIGIAGAFVGALALFAPGTMLLLGVFPFWTTLRQLPGYKAFIAGVSATAIGFVIAACIELWELAVENAADAVVFLSTGSAVALFNAPIPLSIFFGGLLGFSLSPTAIGIGQNAYCPPVAVANGTASSG